MGHGKFEGRAPALLDNLFQAIFLAPLFVWLEMLFQLGYREELKTRLDKWAVEDIAKFRLEKRERGGGSEWASRDEKSDERGGRSVGWG